MDRGSGSTSRWECIDFQLEIREGDPRGYPVAVRSPEGEAQVLQEFLYGSDRDEHLCLSSKASLVRYPECLNLSSNCS